MQTISTKYVGPSNVRGSRIIAKSASGHRRVIPYDHSLNSEDAHAKAVQELCRALDWHGTLVGGHTKDGMVWVFLSGDHTPEYRVEVK